MKRIMQAGAVLVLGLAASACQTVQTTRQGAVGIERQQYMAVSQREVEQRAAGEYRQLLAQEQRRGRLNTQRAQVERVNRIAQQLIPHTAVFRPDAPRWQWEVNVISSNEVNAWCMPGGKMAVYTGLLERLQISDDELAAVLGHEIAHALREHARERISEQMGTQLAVNILGALGTRGGYEGLGKLAGAGMQLLVELPHSRAHETEADRIGVELAARAGFYPLAAVTLWQKMGRVSGGEPAKLLSTHPSRSERTQDLQNYGQRVMPLYQAARNQNQSWQPAPGNPPQNPLPGQPPLRGQGQGWR
ncbi:M48 family metallopeptidase [Massilia sp. W12]|uniref:M48 family metallopeptidase n=1 Tax=Massilia sp. W12 TaxID=3126507 RepID=UPI0030CEEFAF